MPAMLTRCIPWFLPPSHPRSVFHLPLFPHAITSLLHCSTTDGRKKAVKQRRFVTHSRRTTKVYWGWPVAKNESREREHRSFVVPRSCSRSRDRRLRLCVFRRHRSAVSWLLQGFAAAVFDVGSRGVPGNGFVPVEEAKCQEASSPTSVCASWPSWGVTRRNRGKVSEIFLVCLAEELLIHRNRERRRRRSNR